MSHFTVLVAAKDYEELVARLLPYYEYGCSLEMDELVKPYLEFSIKHKAADFEKDAMRIVADDHVQNDTALKGKYEAYLEAQKYTRIFSDWDGGELHGGNWGHWHNPHAKWDWWVVGGRWAGAIFGNAVATPNSPVRGLRGGKNVILVGETDFVAIRMCQSDHAEKEWDNWFKYASPYLDGRAPESLSDEDVREIAKAINDGYPESESRYDNMAEDGAWDAVWFEPEGLTREQYIRAAYNRALTFAFVDVKGNWVERGNMGWWACVSNENDSYDAKFWIFIEALPNEQRLWVVDCHI